MIDIASRRAVGCATADHLRTEGWYNTRRLHSSLGYLSPTYETTRHRPLEQTA